MARPVIKEYNLTTELQRNFATGNRYDNELTVYSTLVLNEMISIYYHGVRYHQM